LHVEYNLTPDDLYAYHWRAFYKSSVLKRSRWKPAAILFAAFALTAVVPAVGPDGIRWGLISWPFLVIVFPISLFLYYVIERSMVRRAIRKLVARERPDRGQIGRHTIRLADDGFLESTAVGESRTFWAGVDRVEQDDAYIFVYTAAAAAHVIPKRAFQGNDADAFFERVKARAEQAVAAPRFGG
jgi:hypothetical protein